MANFNAKPVIAVLRGLIVNDQLVMERVDDAIDSLEEIKNAINRNDDEDVDKVDELQDYLQYLLATTEPDVDEVREELSNFIIDLEKRG